MRDRGGGGVEKVALEAIEVFDRHHEVGSLRLLGGPPQDVGRPLLLIGGRAGARELAERGVIRPANRLGAQHLVDLDHRLEPVASLLADRRIGTDGVVLLGQDCHSRALEPLLVELRADRLVVRGRAAEDGQLDTVEAGGPELAQ